MQNILTSGIIMKECSNVFQLLEFYIYCSMNKQYVEGIQNSKSLLIKSR